MDMAADLRARMAARLVTVAEVAGLVGRTPMQVSRYRTGVTPIPLDVAQKLYRAELLSEESLMGTSEDAA
ncbi:MAG: hypothetical protein JWL76_2148 [Thermoleophilia bacterium]|nr:hypothetical protein [Thermoleophilia bacterium]